jgi:hypothetical protein
MGCSNATSVLENYNLQQTKKINLIINENEKNLNDVQNLIFLIIKIRNRIIYQYHKLIYSCAACLYYKPTITRCIRNIFFKISCELKGKFEDCNIDYFENIPYIKIQNENLSNEINEKINELLNFIIELRICKPLIAQIDKDSPQLLYLEFENHKNISNRNIQRIHNSIKLFEQLKELRNKILTDYKEQIVFYFKRNDYYCLQIDKIGYEAYEKRLNDIYEIGFLNYKDDKKMNDNEKMYSSIDNAKSNWESIMSKDFDVIIDS